MSSAASPWHSDDEDALEIPFRKRATPETILQHDEMPSADATPPRKKRVDWILPEDTDATNINHSETALTNSNQAEEATAEDVRNFLYKISSSDAELRPFALGQTSASLRRSAKPKKSALRRSGDATPTELRPSSEEYRIQVQQHTEENAQSGSRQTAPHIINRDLSGSELFSYFEDGLTTGQTTPAIYEDYEDYVPRPRTYRLGGLSAIGLLKKAREQRHNSRDTRSRQSPRESSTSLPDLLRTGYSGGSTIRSRHNHGVNQRNSPRDSMLSLKALLGGSTKHITASSGNSLAQVFQNDDSPSRSSSIDSLSSAGVFGRLAASSRKVLSRSNSNESLPQFTNTHRRPGLLRSSSSGIVNTLNRFTKSRDDIEVRITKHIQETIQRHRYLLRLCKALMLYGAPTHRLEEYMRASARILEVEAQFLYIPGCMIVSFDDSRTHTTEVKLVRLAQGLDLGKLRDTHEVYKNVIHDLVGVQEATERLVEIENKKDKFNIWLRVFMYGLASASVGPFAFGARLIDLPIAFLLGSILGVLQIVVAPKVELWNNVFELVAVVVTTFLARAFGSINGGSLFCFSALAQSAIALILPGYLVLCSALELQSRSIIAGSVRLVYAIFYSLFLGFGLALGAALYGLIDEGATSSTTCTNSIPEYWFFFSVPIFTVTLIVINQAKYAQMPLMLFIAFAGYLVSYFTSQHFAGNTQISAMFGAFTMSVLANIYGRAGYKVHRMLEPSHLPNPFEQSADVAIVFDPPTPSSLEKQVNPIDDATKGGFGKSFYLFRRKLARWISALFQPTHDEKSTQSNMSSPQDTGTPQPTPASASETGSPPPTTPIHTANTSKPPSHIHYSMSAVLILPGIFVQVPSGLAVSGSLVSGIASANQITGNSTGTSTLTSGDVTGSSHAAAVAGNSVAFNVAYSVLEIAIGITVGLFLGSLVVYPFGKGGGGGSGKGWGRRMRMRGGLFSF